jgi:tetratricopeptide (TPR) repeat protein
MFNPFKSIQKPAARIEQQPIPKKPEDTEMEQLHLKEISEIVDIMISYIKEKKHGRAINIGKKAIDDAYPGSEILLATLAGIYMQLDLPTKALPLYEQAFRYNNQEHNLMYHYAQCLYINGELEPANIMFDIIIAEGSDSVFKSHSHYYRGIIKRDDNNITGAYIDLKKAIEIQDALNTQSPLYNEIKAKLERLLP